MDERVFFTSEEDLRTALGAAELTYLRDRVDRLESGLVNASVTPGAVGWTPKFNLARYGRSVSSLGLVDLGGSGIKYASADLREASASKNIGSIVRHYPKLDLGNFPQTLNELGLLESDIIAVSVPGLVDTSGRVIFSQMLSRANYDLMGAINEMGKAKCCLVMNDADAHLASLVVPEGTKSTATIGLFVGTSIGFSMSNSDGCFVRSLQGFPIDVGNLRISTKASRDEAWWALGKPGLDELKDKMGPEAGALHFGHRLGRFAAQLAEMFQPRRVVLGGGVFEEFSGIRQGAALEFNISWPESVHKCELFPQVLPWYAALSGLLAVVRGSEY